MKPDNASSYRFVPYAIFIFFIFLSAIYSTWFYIASNSYSGLVNSVENGRGIYKKYPIKNQKIKEFLGRYELKVTRNESDSTFFLLLYDDVDVVNLNLMSPVTNKYDQHATMIKNKDNFYEASIKCRDGQWDVEIFLELDDQLYIIRRRIFLYNKKFINESTKYN